MLSRQLHDEQQERGKRKDPKSKRPTKRRRPTDAKVVSVFGRMHFTIPTECWLAHSAVKTVKASTKSIFCIEKAACMEHPAEPWHGDAACGLESLSVLFQALVSVDQCSFKDEEQKETQRPSRGQRAARPKGQEGQARGPKAKRAK